jgi:hypothetical protein
VLTQVANCSNHSAELVCRSGHGGSHQFQTCNADEGLGGDSEEIVGVLAHECALSVQCCSRVRKNHGSRKKGLVAVRSRSLSCYFCSESAGTISLFFHPRAGIRAFPFLTNLYVTVISFTHHPRKNFVLFIASSSDHRTIWNFTA